MTTAGSLGLTGGGRGRPPGLAATRDATDAGLLPAFVAAKQPSPHVSATLFRRQYPLPMHGYAPRRTRGGAMRFRRDTPGRRAAAPARQPGRPTRPDRTG